MTKGIRGTVFFLCLTVCGIAYADQTVDLTTISGTTADDDLIVITTEESDALIASVIAEISKGTATVIGSLAGNDDVTINADLDATSLTGTLIGSNPGKSESASTSIAVASGDGADTINSAGIQNSSATTTVLYADVLQVDDSSLSPGSQKSDVSVKANAEAVGIDSGGDNDIVITSADLTSTATAITGGAAAGIQAEFSNSVSTKATSEAEAKSAGVRAGAGDDLVTNTGEIIANANATSGVISVEVTAADNNDATRKVQGELEASAKAKAESTGIDTDGASTTSDSDNASGLTDDGLLVNVTTSETLEGGADDITNTGGITSTAIATSDSLAVPVSAAAQGSLKATVNAEAEAKSRGISSGAGDDDITNAGSIVAGASATATVIGVSISAGQAAEADQAAKGKTESATNAKAEATSIGIDADGPATSTATTLIATIGRSGISTTYTTNEIAATGADDILNTGAIGVTSTSSAGAGVLTVQVNAEGEAKSEANSTATSRSTGVNAGGGNDSVDNQGAITANAGATASALAITFDQGGEKAESSAEAKVEADATAIGIAGDGGAVDIVTTYSLTIDVTGLNILKSHQETTQHGDDSLLNSKSIGATATALAGAAGAAIAIDGSASSEMTSKATTAATAIDAGGGNDLIDNDGTVTASADSTAGALSIGFAQKVEEKAEAEVEVKATVEAEATATGLAGDSGKDVMTSYELDIGSGGLAIDYLLDEAALTGNDQLFNSGTVTAMATSLSGAAGVSVTIDGASSAELESNAKSQATGIDAGGGDDLVDTSGAVSAGATATSGALAIAVAKKPGEKENASTEASAKAEATATGIAGDSGAHRVTTAALDIDSGGLVIAADRTVTVNTGNDVLTSTADVTAAASATSLTLAVTVAIDGAAKAEMKAEAESIAAGIAGGGGNDQVTSGGIVTADATSFAGGIAAAVGQKSSDDSKAKTKVSAETESKAKATGIATDGGQDDSVESVRLQVDAGGIQFDLEKTTSAAVGDDVLVNAGAVNSSAEATTAAAAAAVTIKGGAQADVDAKAEATSRGLDGGGGADSIDNAGTIVTSATATAITANVSVSTEGSATANVGFLKGGTEVKSDAVGISSAGLDHQTSTIITSRIDFGDFSVTGSFDKIEDSVSADTNDLIINSGTVTTTSNAISLAAGVGVTGKGTALTLGRSEAEAHAGGIESGNGDDRIENTGGLTSNATADAALANVSVTGKGLAVAGNNAWDGGTKAEATATGIDADSGKIETLEVDFEASLERAQVVYRKSETLASGDDVVLNSGDVLAAAVSRAATASVAVSPKGVAAAVSTSTAEAESYGIRGGDGDDHIENSGHVTATADSLAATANVSVTAGSGVSVAADAVWDSGTKAEATAVGIAGDGGNQVETTRLAIGTDEMAREKTAVLASGADTIINFGNVDATAGAIALSAAVAVTASSGVAVATATSTAEAKATAIDAGAGTDIDDVYNAGILHATANASAASASVSVVNTGLAVAGDSVWDGGTKAEARARGIDVGAGGETIVNDGEAHAAANALAGSVAVAVTSTGFAGATATSTGIANASAIDASAGADSDTIINRGALSAAADADAASVSVSFTNTGAALALNAVWEGGTGAEATSRGIETGDGADQVLNNATITSTADSLAVDAAVSIAVTGVAGAVATATAVADATAIDTGGDGAADLVDNSGELIVDANAKSFSASVAVTTTGLALAADNFWDGGTEAHSHAHGIATGGGADTIVNSGAIGLDSDGVTAAASVSVAITGAAGAIARSTATSDATAIDAGDDAAEDFIDNSGALTVTSDAFAAAVSVAVTTAGVSIATGGNWDGGTISDAKARGIFAGQGADDIMNSGVIDVSAGSATGVVDVSVAVTGGAGVISEQSTSRSFAIGIDAGDGAFADTVINDGSIDAGATSLGASASVGVTTAGVAAVWNGGILGDATSRGIATGDGADAIENTAEVDATATAGTVAAAVSVAVAGVAGAVATSDAVADATGIHTGDDDADDLVINTGDVGAEADAIAASAAVSVTAAGVAGAGGDPFDGGTRAESEARGFELGGGADMLFNDGDITADSLATATGVSVAVAVEGVAGAFTNASADAQAFGIDAGTGDDHVENNGFITATSTGNANAIGFAGSKFGVSVAGNNAWDGGTHAAAHSTGIATGAGQDTVINTGGMDIDASSITPALTVAFNVAGVAAAVSTSSAESHAKAIDTGAGDDQIDNSGALTVDADAVAVTVNASITGAGVALSMNSFNGGTTGIATADGIDGGSGADLILNSGLVTTTATVTAPAVSVAVGGIAAVASSTSTADTDATGLNGGDGDDQIQNSADLDVTSDATAIAVNVSVSAGVAGSTDNIWDGGTTATALASGIRGGGGDDVVLSADDVLNATRAIATTGSVAVAVAGGYGIAFSSSTSNATASGIETGDGADVVVNASDIQSGAESTAVSVSAAIAFTGGAAAGNSTWDGGTTANADAFGIALGAGDDEASNTGSVSAVAESTSLSAAIALAPTPGVGVAFADAVSTADAAATAMAGEAGADILVNEGTLLAETDASAFGLNVSFSTTGGAGSGLSTLLDHGTRSHADSFGMTGGDGADGLRNAEIGSITFESDASTSVASVALSLAGVAAAGSNAIAEAGGTGLDGGADDDVLINDGTLGGTALAHGLGGSIALSSFVGLAEANSSGETALTGLAGGDGDDWVENAGGVVLTAESDAIGVSIGGAPAGFALASANADAITNAAGMTGGTGADTLLNSGAIRVIGNAQTVARSIAASAAGYSLSQANTNSTVHTTGLDGGDGDDLIVNDEGALLATSSFARTDSGGAAITIFGAAEGEARTLPRSFATGFAGGAGDDDMLNAGVLVVESKSDSFATGVGAAAAGFANADTGIEAETFATGMTGDEGSDLLVNTGSIRVGPAAGAAGDARWMSLLDSTGFSAGLAGSTATESVSAARTTATGMSGGVGADMLLNEGDLTVVANALNRSSDSTLNLFGTAETNSESGAITIATGLVGGDGDDYVETQGILSVSAESALLKTRGSTNFTLAGTNDSDSGLTARTEARGITGGAGMDTLVAGGQATITALSALSADGGSTTIAGTASAAGSSGANTTAAGIDAGADDDVVLNDADFRIDATSRLTMSGTSYGFAGTSSTGASLTATTTVDGILGGTGNDMILNTGSLDLDARSELSSQNGSDTTFGGSAASTESGARSNARGIAGGDGDDHLENGLDGLIDVAAIARLSTSAVSYTFGGDSGSNVAMTGAAIASGLHGDAGDNTLLNFGAMSVLADVSLVATGGSKTTVTATGGGQSGGHTRSDAIAAGLAAGSGDDLLMTNGTLSVQAISQAETGNSSNTEASLISDSGAQSAATAVAQARGLAAGEGANVLLSAGNVTVRADSNAYSLAFADGASISLAGHATSTVDSQAESQATGIEAGGGDNHVVIEGLLDVTADADTAKTISVTAAIQTFDGTGDPQTVAPIETGINETSELELPALADGGTIANGDYIFWTQTEPDPTDPQVPPPSDDPNVGPPGAYYQAVRTPNFDADGNEIEPTWAWVAAPVFIVERTTELANFPSSAGAVGHGLAGDGRSFANGRATAMAWGIRLGDGNNMVDNEGSIFVTADANANMHTSASAGATGDAEARTTATAEAFAFGAVLGDGNNVFTNRGAIDVEAIAAATAGVDADAGNGICINFIFWTWCIAPGSTTAVPVANRTATAYGILTGNGDNSILNDVGAGITVRAEATGSASLSAAGIVTGSGDDFVINLGLVTATTVQDGVVAAGVGIDLGAGDDDLMLGDGSNVIGSVALGDGDDMLTLIGTPLVHDGLMNAFDIPGGAGFDNLFLPGAGSFAGGIFGFEEAVKSGSGTYSLGSLATVEDLRITDGILALDAGYAFSPTGSYETYLHSDGDRGQLFVDGDVSTAGAISVERRGDTYITDGSRFSVADSTGAVGGAFTDITLPESRPLLSFELEQTASTVDIVANAPNFSTVANNRLHREVADNLYGISGGATGDFAERLGTLQNMPSGFDRAFASLAPDSYDVLTTNTISLGHETTQLLRAHLSDARAFRRGDRTMAAAYEPVMLAYAGGDLRVIGVGTQAALHGPAAAATTSGGAAGGGGQRRSLTWTSAFLSQGDYDLSEGFTRYDYDTNGFVVGFDRLLGENTIAGLMVAYADSNIDQTQAVSSADVENWTGAIYATRFWGGSHVEGGISYSTQSFDNRRTLVIGPDQLTATSSHDGTTLMAFASGGHEFDFGAWQLEPYGSLYYFDIDEDPFEEQGAESLNQIYQRKSTSALLGEVGARFVRLQALKSGLLDWHAVLAYNHDFDLEEGSIVYAYQGAPGSLLRVGDRNATAGSPVLGAGVAYIRNRRTLSLDYRGQFNSDYQNNVLGLRLAVAF